MYAHTCAISIKVSLCKNCSFSFDLFSFTHCDKVNHFWHTKITSYKNIVVLAHILTLFLFTGKMEAASSIFKGNEHLVIISYFSDKS